MRSSAYAGSGSPSGSVCWAGAEAGSPFDVEIGIKTRAATNSRPYRRDIAASQAKSLEPVYLHGEKQGETELTRIAPGKSVTVELRMDWPGTGSVKATPLLSSSQSECYVRVLMVFDTGHNAREYAASAVKYVKIVDE
jgi:hypothetical protein